MNTSLPKLPGSWSELSWQQLCDCWQVKQRYGGHADVARAAALLQLLGMTAIFLAMESWRIPVGDRWIPIQVFGVFALIPIWCYSGKKRSHDQLVQTIFYLFYPVHLVILLLYRSIVRG
jgi:hypothetical protein